MEPAGCPAIISTALLTFHLPPAQLVVYILNAGVIGFVWAVMRRRSGSIVVTSVSHGVWNSIAYVLFGEGTAIGVLGIHNTVAFGPEVGMFGLVLNLAFAAVLSITCSRPPAQQPLIFEPGASRY